MSRFIQIYSQTPRAQEWCHRTIGQKPLFICVLGFTATGLIPGISAAGATPEDRRTTAIADAEFLVNGPQASPHYPLPPLHAGASPVLITRAVTEALTLPVQIFNAGLPIPPAIAAIDLSGAPAQCLSTGQAMPRSLVDHLFQAGLQWGEGLAQHAPYLIISECVVGGTTTALALLTGLGIAAYGKVNSSHPTCNHSQKWQLVQTGLRQLPKEADPLDVVAAIGDPMQIAVAGMAIAASRHSPVLLAGGTQMLAVYALIHTIAHTQSLPWNSQAIAVGTTRWVAEDPTGDTVGLVKALADRNIAVPLLSTPLSFAHSHHATLRAYEQGYVKEGVGAGASAIAAALYQHWGQTELLEAIDQLGDRFLSARNRG